MSTPSQAVKAAAAAEQRGVPRREYYKWLYVCIGLAVLVGSLKVAPPAGMKPEAVRTLAVMVTTILWWVTETFPIPITALMIPLMVHALKIMTMTDAFRESFGNPLVPFMVGVLGLSTALTASGLGKRITYRILSVAGTNTAVVVGVYLWISFLISMFIDDVAVVAMMLPLVLGLLKTIDARPGQSRFGTALMMAIMFGTILGGICTPAGVSSNVITVGFVNKINLKLTFLYWTLVATPIALALNLIAWWVILKLFPPEMKQLPYGREVLREQVQQMGKWATAEKTTLCVFVGAVVLWLTSDQSGIPTAFVSLLILAGITLPGVGVFRSWRDLRIEWGGVLLLAGGFVVGVAAAKTGLASWVVQKTLYPMAALPRFMQPGAVALLVALDSLGFSSFGTTASVNVPFIIAYAQHNGLPVLALTLTAGFASSIHFILVTQSPTLALPYATGYYGFRDLAKIGIVLTVASAIVFSIGMVLAGMPAGVAMIAK